MNIKILITGAVALTFAPALAVAAPGGNGSTNGSGFNHSNGPATTGQPGQTCQVLIAEGAGSTPGQSVNSPGSAFNPAGTAGSVYAGTQSVNNRNSASVSQYDVACLHGTK
jgi:hypothetical protein